MNAKTKTRTHFDFYIFEKTEILNLMGATTVVVIICTLVVVGLDCTNVVRRAFSKRSNQLINGRFDLLFYLNQIFPKKKVK